MWNSVFVRRVCVVLKSVFPSGAFTPFSENGVLVRSVAAFVWNCCFCALRLHLYVYVCLFVLLLLLSLLLLSSLSLLSLLFACQPARKPARLLWNNNFRKPLCKLSCPSEKPLWPTPSPPTESLGFRGFDSSRPLILRGGNSHIHIIV